jgi:hypothetical protein
MARNYKIETPNERYAVGYIRVSTIGQAEEGVGFR